MTKRESIDLAKRLMDEKKFNEASKIFNEAQKSFPDEIDAWDVFFMLKCDNSDKGDNSDKVNNLPALAEKFIETEQVKNLYIWYLYYKYGKKITGKNIREIEGSVIRLLEIGIQKDFLNCTEEEGKYPCPYTLTVGKIIKAYKKPNFNRAKVEEYLRKLDPEKLSRDVGSMTDEKGRDRELASPYEDYFANLSTLKLKNEKYQECIDTCNFALNSINKLHYDNDIWFKRRKAISLIKLGNEEEGFDLLLSLSKDRKGDKWFLYHEIAEIYFENEDYEQAMDFCKKGITAHGDEDFKINLLILTARTLFKLECMDDAAILANYMIGISLVHDLKEKADLSRISSYFNIDKSSIEEPKKYLSKYRRKTDEVLGIDRNVPKNKAFVSRKPANINTAEEMKGRISTVHGNGKSGHVKVGDESYFFSMKDVQIDKEKLNKGINVMVGFKDAKDKEGKPAKHGVILNIIE